MQQPMLSPHMRQLLEPAKLLVLELLLVLEQEQVPVRVQVVLPEQEQALDLVALKPQKLELALPVLA